MQTFLPYSSFSQSAACLDSKRLGKQRVECLQILNSLLGKSSGWINHPAVKMWAGCEGILCNYAYHICQEWVARGFKDTCVGKIAEFETKVSTNSYSPPAWLGDESFHLSHKSNLIRKLPEHYGKLWPDVPHDIPYVWPA